MPIHSDIAARRGEDHSIILSWSVHLAKEQPAKAVMCLALIAFAMTAGYHAVGLLGPVAAAAAMLGALSEFLFPVTYQITREGASCRMLFKSADIKWERVRRCYVDRTGVKLSPLAHPTRLEAFRGVYLRFSGNDEQVIDAVRSLRSPQCTE